MTVRQEIKKWRKHFGRVLKGWRITYDPHDRKYKKHVGIYTEFKQAVIYGFGKKPVPKDYVMHEMLHVCIRAIKDERCPVRWREMDEFFVQDLCALSRKRC